MFNWISKFWEKRSTLANPVNWMISWLGGVKTASGQQVNETSALQASAVYACVRLISETIASLPLQIYQRGPNNSRELAPDYRWYEPLHSLPNGISTSFEWRQIMMADVLLSGNGYSWIGDGVLIRLHPHSVKVEISEDLTQLIYMWTPPTGGPITFGQGQIHHLRGLSRDGITGLSPIAVARESIGLAMATEQHGANLFGNGAMPAGVLRHPQPLKEPALRNIESSWREKYGGENSGGIAVLEEGMEFQPISMTSEDAQFLETRKFQVTDIARIFRVPPSMIGDLERATFSNVEQQALDFVTNSIRPWLVNWEQAISRDLIAPFERSTFFAEFNVDGLLRGDAVSRSAALQTQLMNGALTIDEWRQIENRNPMDDDLGKSHYIPQNLKEVGEEPEPEPPPALVPPGLMPVTEGEEEEERLLHVVCEQLAKRIVSEEEKQLTKKGGITRTWHAQHVKRAERWAAAYGDDMPARAKQAVESDYKIEDDWQETRIAEIAAILTGKYQ